MGGVLWLVGVALAVLVADQLSKRAVVRRLDLGERRPLRFGLALAHVTNPRGGLVALPTPVTAGIALAVTVLAVALAADPVTGAATVAGLGLGVGGMAGNLVDRVRLGAVVDVLSLWRWRVANLADVALVAGAVLVVVAALGATT